MITITIMLQLFRLGINAERRRANPAGNAGGGGRNPAKENRNREAKTMKNITKLGDLNKYYMYKGYFITRDRRSGFYSTYTDKGRLMADTQRGIKKLINEKLINEEETK